MPNTKVPQQLKVTAGFHSSVITITGLTYATFSSRVKSKGAFYFVSLQLKIFPVYCARGLWGRASRSRWGLMCAEGGCLSRFFPRVGNAAVLQTVWAAEMVAGLGGGGGGGAT